MLQQNEEVEAVVGESQLEADPDGLGLIRLVNVAEQTPLGKGTLLLAQPASGTRVVGQDEGGDTSEGDRDNALDDEEPAPAGNALGTVHVAEHSSADDAAEHVGQGVSRVEERHSARQLGAGVPGAHEEDGAGEEGGLDETEDEAHGDEITELAGCGVASRDGAPEGHGGGEVDGRAHARDEEVGWQLHQEVGDEEDGRGQVEVGPGHAEVSLERALAGLGEVGTVEEVEQVHEDEAGQQMQVHLAHQGLVGGLDGGLIAALEFVDPRPELGVRVLDDGSDGGRHVLVGCV